MSESNKQSSVWNVPNILTMARVVLIVPFAVLLLGGQKGWFGTNLLIPDILADIIFIIASLTDMLDGKLARKMGLVTNFGKFMDPLADKLLVCTALIALQAMNRIPAWVVMIIIAREFIISGFRLVASDNGVVIAASYWGKFKTTFQMIMVILMIANIEISWVQILTQIIMWIDLSFCMVRSMEEI